MRHYRDSGQICGACGGKLLSDGYYTWCENCDDDYTKRKYGKEDTDHDNN